ncbi:MAG TPA: AMP-binding protein [Umezawaea sp.]|nr:AMP-binding protein [Umezawaea sp.]
MTMPPTGHYVSTILEVLGREPERTAVRFSGGSLTAAEFTRSVLTAADVIASTATDGARPVVAILTEINTPATLILRYAANLAGAMVVHLHSTNAVDPTDQLAERHRRTILGATGTTILAVDAANLPLARRLLDGLDRPPRLAAPEPLAEDVLDLSSGDPGAVDLDAVADLHDEPAVILYTSGSTGAPKGIAVPFHLRRRYIEAALTSGDTITYLATLPVSHSTGGMADNTLASGGTIVFHNGFDASRFLDTVESDGISLAVLSPSQLYQLLDHPRVLTADLSSLQGVMYVGSPASPARLAEAVKVFGERLVQFYGTTETGGITMLLPNEHFDPELRRTVGRPMMAEVRIHDPETDELLATGETGEICVRSPLTMLGYWGEPELTARTIRDGWLHTGDLGSLDDKGYLRIHGRLAEVIKAHGIKIRPSTVEQALLSHPAVAQAAVYCVVDADRREFVHAVVVQRETVAVEDLSAHVAAELSEKHTPDVIRLRDRLPLDGAGKPDKVFLAAEDKVL